MARLFERERERECVTTMNKQAKDNESAKAERRGIVFEARARR